MLECESVSRILLNRKGVYKPLYFIVVTCYTGLWENVHVHSQNFQQKYCWINAEKETICSRKDQLLYMFFSKLGLVAIEHVQWEDVLIFIQFSKIFCWTQTWFLTVFIIYNVWLWNFKSLSNITAKSSCSVSACKVFLHNSINSLVMSLSIIK